VRLAHLYRQHVQGAAEVAAVLARVRRKRISAMVRVHNEAELLSAVVRSIAALVDEVVIVDNGSTDGTAEVIRALACDLPDVRSYFYPHQVARAGIEHRDAVRAGADSPCRRLSEYSNWALARCRYPFVLKWDGDMIAGAELGSALEAWHSGRYLAMRFKGLNAHPDRVHLLGARSRDRAVVGRPLAGDFVPWWALQMTYCDPETRVFPRALARFDDSRYWWCESLRSFFNGPPAGNSFDRFKLEVADPLYLHVKYWKRSPHTNHSPDLRAMIEENMTVGPPIPDAWQRVAYAYGLRDQPRDRDARHRESSVTRAGGTVRGAAR
jgi:glycosyltransferase involved in cell wall biosynthesis